MLMFLILLMQIQIRLGSHFTMEAVLQMVQSSYSCAGGWEAGILVWLNLQFRLHYQKQAAGIFACLQDFVKECATHCHIPFLNIMDKGYNCIMAASHARHHLLLQLDFMRNIEGVDFTIKNIPT
jgi:hypothetical protein